MGGADASGGLWRIWAWLIVHYAIAVLIARAAEAADVDPDRISFTRALRIVRSTATGTADFPPSGLGSVGLTGGVDAYVTAIRQGLQQEGSVSDLVLSPHGEPESRAFLAARLRRLEEGLSLSPEPTQPAHP